MPRTKQSRKVNYSPRVSYFKPMGVNTSEKNEVVMSPEEIEAMRLIDLKELPQNDAAQSMEVSQPTFSRILKSSRKKVSEAIVLGKTLKIEGGNVLIKKPFSLESLKEKFGSL